MVVAIQLDVEMKIDNQLTYWVAKSTCKQEMLGSKSEVNVISQDKAEVLNVW